MFLSFLLACFDFCIFLSCFVIFLSFLLACFDFCHFLSFFLSYFVIFLSVEWQKLTNPNDTQMTKKEKQG